MNKGVEISDDLRGLLEDIALSPKQRLFAGSFMGRVASSFDGHVARPSQTGLSSAERHLLVMHRRELSIALQYAFYDQFFAKGGPSEGIHAYATGELSTQQEWANQTHVARDTAPPEAFSPGTTTWLHRLLGGYQLKSFDDYQGVLAASLHLTGSPSAQLYSGFCSYVFGAEHGAMQTFSQLGRSASNPIRIASLRYLQGIVLDAGHPQKAVQISIETLRIALAEGWEEEAADEFAKLELRGLTFNRAWQIPEKVRRLSRGFSVQVHAAVRRLAKRVTDQHELAPAICTYLGQSSPHTFQVETP